MAPPESPMVMSNAHQNGLQRKSPFPRDAPASVRGHKQELKVWVPSGKVQSNRSLSATPTPRAPHPPRTPGKENNIDLAPLMPDLDSVSKKEAIIARCRSESPGYMAPTRSSKLRVQKDEQGVKKPKKLPPVPRKPRMSVSTESILSSTTDDPLALQCKQVATSIEETEESKSSADTNVCVQDVQPTVVAPEVPMEIPQAHHKTPQQVTAHHKKVHKPVLKSLMCCMVPSASTYD